MIKVSKSILLIFLLIILAEVYIFFALGKVHLNKVELLQQVQPPEKPERIGERITYDVRLGKLSLGRAVFRHLPKAELNGKKVSLMTFETKVTRFTDLERIYSDADSFLPLRVERSIKSWPFLEKIVEDYDQERFILCVRKLKGSRENKKIIKKDNPINNAILLPYYVRDAASLHIGYEFMARLPTQEFLIKLVAKEEVSVPAGKFMAWRFESSPKKFEIWISADERRIPLKIKGTSGLGYTLVMREYRLD